jgi:antiviral defense system Shedu protein SduA
MINFTFTSPLLRQLAKHGLEFDQKLQRALEVSSSKPDLTPEDHGFPDSYLTLALYRLNSVLTSLVTLNENRYNVFHEYKLAPPCRPQDVRPGRRLCRVLDKAAELAAPGKTIGAGHFLKAIASRTLDERAWDAPGFPGQVIHNTFSAETLLWGLGHTAWTSIDNAPEVRDILSALDGRHPVDDCQYLMTIENGKLIVRPTSRLGTFHMSAGLHAVNEHLGVLTHFKDRFAAVTPDELLELDDLINNLRVSEIELQRFFEQHPHFFRMWDYREVFPHVYLTREEDGPLIPDFLLLDRELQKAMVVDLKLPSAKTVVFKKNRERFSALIDDARAQLLAYRDWFEDSHNRRKLKERFGMEIYRPRLGVIVGSTKTFLGDVQQQKLRSRYPDVEIASYEDVFKCAQRRLAIIRSASREAK